MVKLHRPCEEEQQARCSVCKRLRRIGHVALCSWGGGICHNLLGCCTRHQFMHVKRTCFVQVCSSNPCCECSNMPTFGLVEHFQLSCPVRLTTLCVLCRGPLGWLIPSEVNPVETRAAGTGICTCVNFLMTFLIGQVRIWASICSRSRGVACRLRLR